MGESAYCSEAYLCVVIFATMRVASHGTQGDCCCILFF